MTASIPIFSPMVRVTDADGEPVANGTVEFYNAGTSTAKTVYADKDLSTALGTTVSTDSGGYPVTSGNARTLVYTGTDAFKMIVKDSSGATLVTHDNVPGAVIVPEAETSALSETPVVSKTTNYTVVAGDQGTILNCNCTSASFAITLLSAVTAGDGFEVTGRHAGTANQVTIRTAGTETISHSGKASYAVSLKAYGQALVLVSDGANWLVKASAEPRMLDGTPHFNVVDRLTATPSSPTAGARYIISGSPTGTWSTLGFSSGQVAEADGNGSWFAYTPAEGWSAWVEDEHLQTVYTSGAWTDWTNVTAPTETALGIALYSYTVPQNTAGVSATNSSWTAYPLNTEDHDTIGGSINSGTYTITLPTGTYIARMSATFYAAQTARFRVSNVTTSAKVYGMLSYSPAFGTTPPVATASTTVMVAPFSVSAATEDIKIEYYQVGASATLGVAQNVSGLTEKYGQLEIIKLDAQQGPQGEQGIQGEDGLDAAYDFQWSTSTSGDPGSGKLLLNNATFNSVTQLNISETTASGADIAAVIATWDDSTSAIKGHVKFSKEGTPGTYRTLAITGSGTDQGGYWTFPVTPVDDFGSLSASDDLAVLHVRTGDKGDTGAAGSNGSPGATGDPGATGATGPNTGLDYAWSTATSGDPGSGKVLANNGTLSSATAINISKTGRNAESLGAVIATWDDSTNIAHYGHLRIFTVADRTEYIEAEVTGLTDNSTYYAVAVTVTSANGTPSDNDVMAVMFERTGNKGNDGAGVGDALTANPLSQFASTTSAQLAGVISDETGSGALVFATSPTLVTPALGTPSSGTLTNCTGLPQAGVTGLTTSDSPQFAGVNVGHASDTTITRASAGVIAVEGVTVPLNSTSSTHTAQQIEVGHASDTTISRSAAGVIAVEGVPLYAGIPITDKSADYTLVLADAQTCIRHPGSDSNNRTYTIPANASVAYPVGTVITFMNNHGTNTVTIAITSDTLTAASSGSTGSRTLGAHGVATAIKIASTSWFISGVALT